MMPNTRGWSLTHAARLLIMDPGQNGSYLSDQQAVGKDEVGNHSSRDDDEAVLDTPVPQQVRVVRWDLAVGVIIWKADIAAQREEPQGVLYLWPLSTPSIVLGLKRGSVWLARCKCMQDSFCIIFMPDMQNLILAIGALGSCMP